MSNEFINLMREHKYISPEYEDFLLENILNEGISQELISIDSINKINMYFIQIKYPNNFLEREKYVFLLSVSKYLILNNLPISNPTYLFTLFTYIHDENFIQILEKIYTNCSDYSKLQINYLFIIIIFLKLEKIIETNNLITDILDKDEQGFEKKIMCIKDIIKFGIKKNIITNPLISTQEFINSNELVFPSIFDILAYCVYSKRNHLIIVFLLKLIKELILEDDTDKIILLTKNKVNIDSLFFLYKHFDNDSDDEFNLNTDILMILEEMVDKYNENDKYVFTFVEIINKIMINYKTKQYVDKKVYQIVKKTYLNLFEKSINFFNLSNDSEHREIFIIYNDLNKINDNDIYEKFISSLRNSKEITDIKKIFYLNAMFRYYISNLIVSYDCNTKEYFIIESKSNEKIIIEEKDYFEKCLAQIQGHNSNTLDSILYLLKMFNTNIYANLSELESINEENYQECVICMCDIKKNKKICFGCKNVFHRKCIFTWIDKKKISCPICRRNLTSVFEPNPEEKYKLFGYLIENLQKKI